MFSFSSVCLCLSGFPVVCRGSHTVLLYIGHDSGSKQQCAPAVLVCVLFLSLSSLFAHYFWSPSLSELLCMQRCSMSVRTAAAGAFGHSVSQISQAFVYFLREFCPPVADFNRGSHAALHAPFLGREGCRLVWSELKKYCRRRLDKLVWCLCSRDAFYG